MSSPTQNAQVRFDRAHQQLMEVMGIVGDADPGVPMRLREGLKEMARGMGDMAVGLRATYQLIEQLQKEIRELKLAQQRGRS